MPNQLRFAPQELHVKAGAKVRLVFDISIDKNQSMLFCNTKLWKQIWVGNET